MPNIAKATENAAAEYLQHLPYARFVDDEYQAVEIIDEILLHLPELSEMAMEIGTLYDDEMLSRLLAAKICNKNAIGIADFDGTLFHKDDHEKTLRCMDVFRRFPVRVICSARPIQDLQARLKFYQLEVDWMIGCSGSAVANGQGQLLWLTPLNLHHVSHLERSIPQAKRLEVDDHVLQIAGPIESLPNLKGYRLESYQDTAYIAHWQASKFHAVHRLLRYLNWSGQVQVYGDGPYDSELLAYFDGTLITPQPQNNLQKRKLLKRSYDALSFLL